MTTNKTKKASRLSVALVMAAFVAVSSSTAYAAQTPTYLIASVNNNTQAQITVIGADANATVTLYYPVNSTYSPLNIGTTNTSGYFSSVVNPTTYNITAGGPSYVMVNGAQSQTQNWPAYTASSQSNSSGSLYLSQSNVTITSGQSGTVMVSSNSGSAGTISVPTNTNPSVASAWVSGNQITVNGAAAGSTMLTVCGSNVGCGTLYVTVQQTSSSGSTQTTGNSSIVSFNPSSITMKKGESRTVTLSGPGSYYISAHSNPSAVSNSLSGSTLTVNGVAVGTDDMSVCGTSGGTTSCSSLVVKVDAADSTSSTNTEQKVAFSRSDVTLSLGQTETVTVSGTGLGSFYLSSNSNTSAVSANLTGSSVSLYGQAIGGSNITICQFGGVCGTLYAYVPVSGSGQTTAPAASTASPVLSSFSVSSNNVGGGFMSSGAALTFSFGFSRPVSSKSFTVNGTAPAVYGSGSGPYTAIYTVAGNERQPLPVALAFTGSSGGSGQASFTIGGSAAAQAQPGTQASAGSYVFARYLYQGMTPQGVSDPDVRALQARLAADGSYSGPVTGYFGPATKAGLIAYQKKHGIDPLGVVGPSTRALLNKGN